MEVAAGFMAAWFICFVICIVVGLALSVFWLWMLVDCLAKEPSAGNEKLLWAVVILLTHALGALLYYVIRRPQRIKQCGQ
jgi:hypothetical protein